MVGTTEFKVKIDNCSCSYYSSPAEVTFSSSYFLFDQKLYDGVLKKQADPCLISFSILSFKCSTLGQGLQTSTYPGESIFSIALAIFGLILFALLIGNMQVNPFFRTKVGHNRWLTCSL